MASLKPNKVAMKKAAGVTQQQAVSAMADIAEDVRQLIAERVMKDQKLTYIILGQDAMDWIGSSATGEYFMVTRDASAPDWHCTLTDSGIYPYTTWVRKEAALRAVFLRRMEHTFIDSSEDHVSASVLTYFVQGEFDPSLVDVETIPSMHARMLNMKGSTEDKRTMIELMWQDIVTLVATF
jgi:hypothetical protein